MADEDVWEAIRGKHISEVVLPGSHDSGAYDLTDDRSPEAPDIVAVLERCQFVCGTCSCGLLDIVRGWSTAQGHTIPGQLQLGVRYLDLRVAWEQATGQLRLCHGLYARGALDETLVAIGAFLEAHRGEFLILDFNHMFEIAKEQHELLCQMLSVTLGKLMVPRSQAHLTLGELRQLGYRVLVLYAEQETVSQHSFLLGQEAIQSLWPDTMSVHHLFAILDRGLACRSDNRGFNHQCLHVSQGILTPSTSTIVTGVLMALCCCWGWSCFCCCIPVPTGLKTLSQRNPGVNRHLREWVAEQSQQNLNVVLADYICDSPELIHAIISKNMEPAHLNQQRQVLARNACNSDTLDKYRCQHSQAMYPEAYV